MGIGSTGRSNTRRRGVFGVVLSVVTGLLVQCFAIAPAGATLAGSPGSEIDLFPPPFPNVTPCYGAIQTSLGGIYEESGNSCAAWDTLEELATDDVIADKGLIDDPVLAKVVATDAIRAAMWARMLAFFALPRSQRTDWQNEIADWWAGVIQRYNTLIFTSARAEFDEFDAGRTGDGACTYVPPSPYEDEYPAPGQSRPSGCLFGGVINFFDLGPNYPQYENWVKWGTAAVQNRLAPNSAVYRTTSAMSAETIALASGITGGAVAIGAVSSAVAVIASQTALITSIVATVAPYAIRAGLWLGTTVAGVSVGASVVVGIVAIAVIGIILGAVQITERDRIIERLNAGLATAQTTVIDPQTYITDPGNLATLTSLFADFTTSHPRGAPAPTAPARTPTDATFAVAGSVSDDATVSSGFPFEDWDGIARRAELQGGYFVVNGAPTTTLRVRAAFPGGGVAKALLTRIVTAGGTPRFALVPAEQTAGVADCTADRSCPVSPDVSLVIGGRIVSVTMSLTPLPPPPPASLGDISVSPNQVEEGATADVEIGDLSFGGSTRAVAVLFVETPTSTNPLVTVLSCAGPRCPSQPPASGLGWTAVGPVTGRQSVRITVPDAGTFRAVVVLSDPSIGFLGQRLAESNYATFSGVNTRPELAVERPCPQPEGTPCSTLSVDEGEAAVLRGTILERGSGLLTVTARWGDGSPDETESFELPAPAVFCGLDPCPPQVRSLSVVGGPPLSTFSASHVYADQGRYPAELEASDDETPPLTSRTGTVFVDVRNVAPTATVRIVEDAVDPGSSVTVEGTVTDPGVADAPTVALTFDNGIAPVTPTLVRNGTSATFSTVVQVPSTATSMTVTATATDKDGATGTATATTAVSVPTPPSAPTGLRLSGRPFFFGTGSLVDIIWSDTSSNETGFVLQRGRWNGADWVEWTSTSLPADSSMADAVLPDGRYAFVLTSVNAAGSSDPVIGTIVLSTAGSAPRSPSALSASVVGAGVEVNWTDAADDEFGYELTRARWNGVAWTEWTTVVLDRDAASFDDPTVPDGSYAYLVRAYNAVGASEWAVTTVTVSSASTPPAAPSGASVAADVDDVTVSWADESTDEMYFELARARYNPVTDTWGEWAFFVTDRNRTSFEQLDVPAGQYVYAVRAVNSAGPSAWVYTGLVRVSDPFAMPSAPSGLRAVREPSSVTLDWDDTSLNEIFFEVMRAHWDGTQWTGWTSWVLDRNTMAFTDTSPPANPVAYLVRAVNGAGASTWAVTVLERND